jgi:hypothetical protein
MVAPLAMSLLVAAAGLTGCSSGSTTPAATSSSPPRPTTSSASPTPPPDRHALLAIAAAARVMRQVRSYRFVADEQLVAASGLRTHLAGSLVRDQGLTYRLTVGHKTTQVVRLRAATYVRVVPHRWSRLRHPRQLANPTSTLLQILYALQPIRLATSHGVKAVHGRLAPAAARAAGLPATRAADVTVTIDRGGHVVALDVRTTTQISGHDVMVSLRTAYSGFGQVGAIRRPV